LTFGKTILLGGGWEKWADRGHAAVQARNKQYIEAYRALSKAIGVASEPAWR